MSAYNEGYKYGWFEAYINILQALADHEDGLVPEHVSAGDHVAHVISLYMDSEGIYDGSDETLVNRNAGRTRQ